MKVLWSIMLVLGGLLAGAAGGAYHPWVMGVQGAVLGAGMSVSVVALNRIEQARLDAGKGPRWWVVAVTGLVTGLVLGVVLWLYRRQTPAPPPLVPLPLQPMPVGWPLLAQAVALILAMHLVYRLRWLGGMATFFAPWLVAATVVGTVMVSDLMLHAWDDPASSLLLAVIGGLPLGLGWGLSAAWFDPAFMKERWLPVEPAAPAAQ